MDQKASSADAHQHKKRKIDDETPCSDILLVSVGPDQELFVVHLDKLTNASELFRQILQASLQPIAQLGFRPLKSPRENQVI